MTEPTEAYTEEFVPVSKLEIDRRVQRAGLTRTRVTEMVRNWNPLALGVIHVSRRRDGSLIVIDGQHRHAAASIITDNTGELWCRIYSGLTLAQESQLFLDLNRTSAPSLIDKFNVLMSGDTEEAEAAKEVARIVGEYGWKVSRTPGPSHINCVRVIQRIYTKSELLNRDPNILRLTVMAITNTWGTSDRTAVNGAIVEAVAAIFDEYGSSLDTDRFLNIMSETEGGPVGLLARATQMAKIRKGRTAMAVAYLLIEAYNKGLRARTLGQWRRR